MSEEKVKVKKTRQKKGPFIVGLLVLCLAIVGIVSIARQVSDILLTGDEETVDYSDYAGFLTWVVGVDPDPFTDITKANIDTLRNIALCNLLSDEIKTGEYNVTENGLIVPAGDVESNFLNMFGADVQITHGTVVGYGYEFIYNAAENTYTVPLTGVTPPFSPRIESVKRTGNLVELRVGFVGTNNVEVLPDGTLSATQPDKYADIIIKETETGYNLISLMTVTVGEHG